MKKTEVSAKIGKDGAPIKIEYEFPETVEEAIDAFGEDVVLSNFISSTTISLQGLMRNKMKAGKTAEEIQAELGPWKPGVRAKGKSTMEKAFSLLGMLSDEERSRLLEQWMDSEDDEG